MHSLCDRLRAERDRLGLSQSAMADLAGVTKQSQFNYEKGVRIPDAKYLVAVGLAGADILYVLTGMHTPPEIRDNVARMLATTAEVDPAGEGDITKHAIEAAIAMPRQYRRIRMESLMSALSDTDLDIVESLLDRLSTASKKNKTH